MTARVTTLRSIVFAAIGGALTIHAAPAADAEHGREVFVACLACHSEKPEALGPSLKGVFGRKAATLEDFRYSNPMRRANLVWDEANLRDYIADPQTKVKGNRMPFGGLGKPEDIDDVIAFLKTYR
jgi:cytochrome c